VIDTLAFTAQEAATLIAERQSYGRLCVIWTGSVHADAEGRGFETAQARGFPDYPFAISENQVRMPPGPAYSAEKVAMEDALLAADLPLVLFALRLFMGRERGICVNGWWSSGSSMGAAICRRCKPERRFFTPPRPPPWPGWFYIS
jgi:hypothetical protein